MERSSVLVALLSRVSPSRGRGATQPPRDGGRCGVRLVSSSLLRKIRVTNPRTTTTPRAHRPRNHVASCLQL
jgi:hypothetical protein